MPHGSGPQGPRATAPRRKGPKASALRSNDSPPHGLGPGADALGTEGLQPHAARPGTDVLGLLDSDAKGAGLLDLTLQGLRAVGLGPHAAAALQRSLSKSGSIRLKDSLMVQSRRSAVSSTSACCCGCRCLVCAHSIYSIVWCVDLTCAPERGLSPTVLACKIDTVISCHVHWSLNANGLASSVIGLEVC